MPTDPRTELDVAADALRDWQRKGNGPADPTLGPYTSTMWIDRADWLMSPAFDALGIPSDAPEGTIAACLKLTASAAKSELFRGPDGFFTDEQIAWLKGWQP